ncbi:agmatinase [Acidianus ambivalens]|uniref:Agmatinase n=1 Tax=Acidianus ambivalens TaxID=2283 RepID=A0A650CWP6_ACIAM|nr:agmatinase [Acidianus ambivalens]MQL54401.1 agmatinase [Acidianus ambivalens]QGR22223.1 agmatinase [Acidianus ambivalens]
MRQIDALKSPRFTQVSTFARLPLCEDLSEVKAVFLGIPFDDATTYRPGARFGPMGIRQGSRLLRPYNQFLDVYPFDTLNMCDAGDINVIPGYIDDTFKIIEEELNKIHNIVPFIAGGDHSITLPILRAMHKKYGKVNLVHLDSHYDFWDSYWGKKYTHGTWLRRALEEGLLNEVVQMGIRGSLYSRDDVEDSKRLRIKSFTIRDLKYKLEEVKKELPSGKTYVSIDIDVVDPAFAPGTGTPEVGGLTSFEILEIVRSFNFNIVGFDVVEVSPPYDTSEITTMLAANILYEGASVLAKKM